MKGRLRVLILGPYAPKRVACRLEKLKKCLIEKGFLLTKLVRDFDDNQRYSQDSDEHFTLKSQKYIREWADVPIFVFMRDADNQGVTIELTYACQALVDKQSCCASFFEGRWEDYSRLMRGQVKLTRRVSHFDFGSDEDLCQIARGHAVKMLDRLYYFLT